MKEIYINIFKEIFLQIMIIHLLEKEYFFVIYLFAKLYFKVYILII